MDAYVQSSQIANDGEIFKLYCQPKFENEDFKLTLIRIGFCYQKIGKNTTMAKITLQTPPQVNVIAKL